MYNLDLIMTFITLKLIKKLIIVTYFVLTTYANFILSVSSTSYSVNNQANLTINIRTSTPISVLDIVLSDAFVVKSPVCRINSTSSTCNKVIPSTGNLIYVRFSFNFLTNMNYTLTFNITNPSYSESFSIQGLNGAVFFGNSGTLTIDPKKINCSMSSTSTIVGQSSNTTFLIKLETMQAGTTGQISLTVNSQQVFPNVINSSPSCSVDSFSTGCNLGQIFGSQVLSLNSVDIGVRANPIGMQLLVNSIRNSPFNSSFVNIKKYLVKYHNINFRSICKKNRIVHCTAAWFYYITIEFRIYSSRLGIDSWSSIECSIYPHPVFYSIN